jgi:hypothetical protein
MTADQVVWLYAFATYPAPPAPQPSTGVGGAPVRLVAHAGLVAAVSSVPRLDFGPEPLRRHLEDLDWLAQTARAHNAVIETMAGLTTIVPVRLATVFSDDDRVRELLDMRCTQIEAALRALAGRSEWGVKAYGDPRAMAVGSQTPPAAAPPGAGAGTAYLQRRRAELSTEDVVQRVGQQLARQMHAALLAVSVAGRQNPPQDAKLAGTREWMVLNGTYLVDDRRAQTFREVVVGLDAERADVRLELTGPWPPYSFSGVQEVETT